MPTYSYSCSDCGNNFELFFYIKDYVPDPPCTKCKESNTYRRYLIDVSSQSTSVKKSDSELKTLGDLARRNADRMSEDQKTSLYQKHNAYKEEPNNKPLPNGMNRIKKPPKPNWRKL